MSDKFFFVVVDEVERTLVRGRDESDSVDESYAARGRFLFRERGLISSESKSDGTVSGLAAKAHVAKWYGPG